MLNLTSHNIVCELIVKHPASPGWFAINGNMQNADRKLYRWDIRRTIWGLPASPLFYQKLSPKSFVVELFEAQNKAVYWVKSQYVGSLCPTVDRAGHHRAICICCQTRRPSSRVVKWLLNKLWTCVLQVYFNRNTPLITGKIRPLLQAVSYREIHPGWQRSVNKRSLIPLKS